jgi:uncharacterized membrane protein YidH (DUF202 family)
MLTPSRRRWLGLLLVVAGLILMAIGAVSFGRLLTVPLEAQRRYLAPTMSSLVVGLWLLIGGLRALR